YELIAGSGGPGKFRGGMGLRRSYRAHAAGGGRVDLLRLRSGAWGFLGGPPGPRRRGMCGPGGAVGKDKASLQAGQWFEVLTPGAGGYGPPLKRDRAMIARDLDEGLIDAETARKVYGYES